MRIAAHIGVKDEIDLIGQCIAHMRDIGVSEFIVCDVDSTDGTAEFLEGQRSESFRILHTTNADSGEEWLLRNAVAARRATADWVVFADADEFILPVSGWLPEILARAPADLISIPRFNVPLGEAGPRLPPCLFPERYDEVDLIVAAPDHFRTVLAEGHSLPWIRAVPSMKVMVRPQLIAGLVDGMHDVIPVSGVSPRRIVASDVVTAHVPFSTEARFLRKVENIRDVFSVHDEYFGADLAWHWRHWLELASAGRLGDEFKKTRFSENTLAALRESGVIQSAAAVLSRGRPGGALFEPAPASE